MGKSCARAQYLMSLKLGVVRISCAQGLGINLVSFYGYIAPSFGSLQNENDPHGENPRFSGYLLFCFGSGGFDFP
jgi:hypothetical protein